LTILTAAGVRAARSLQVYEIYFIHLQGALRTSTIPPIQGGIKQAICLLISLPENLHILYTGEVGELLCTTKVLPL
jgi:hypothetical protein